MSDDAEDVTSRMLKAIDDCKQRLITKEELRSIAFQAAGELELGQWRIIENLRARSPEIADVLAAKLREGSGNA
jgi:F0F1-type ATP synthase membrane subunit b/b'